MSPPIRHTLFIAALALGCASGPRVEPSTQSTPPKDERPATELVNKGRDAAARGDAVRAEQYLSMAIERGADRRLVLPMLMEACLNSSHLRAALNHAEPYLREHPEDDALRYLVANIHVSLGQDQKARTELGLLLQNNPRNADAHYLFGVIESASNPQAAREHFVAAADYTFDPQQRTEVKSRLAELRLSDSALVHRRRVSRPSKGGQP